MKYSLAFSPCPNDTFMMHGVMSGRVQQPGLTFDLSLHDIQELNTGMAHERFDLCKVSSVSALRHSEQYELCSSGAALGYGVGPLLLKRPGAVMIEQEGIRVLCPGAATTAYALLRLLYPRLASHAEHVTFSEIMPALQRGDADCGVVIHEGRFTYEALGLELVADLGCLWEQRFSLPLPLGCFVAHRRVDEEHRRQFVALIRRSIEYAYAHRLEVYATMKQYAQELDDRAIWSHVELYVNQWSLDLGEVGHVAFAQLARILHETASRERREW